MNARDAIATCTVVIAAATAALTVNAHNADFAITSADICAPVNVGKANRNIQNIRGTVKNLSEDESIAVSCPLVTVSENGFFQLSVVVENESSESENFRCVLREKDIFNLDVQTLTRSVDVEGNAIAFLDWQEVNVVDAAIDRMNLTCLLPPLSNLGLITSFSL